MYLICMWYINKMQDTKFKSSMVRLIDLKVY